MNFLHALLRRLGLARAPAETFRFELDTPARAFLEDLARQEQRPAQQVAARLLHSALAERQQAEAGLRRWRALSPREQEVAALTCLGYTNRQIAARLGISPETVKTHLRNLLAKFGARTKAEMRARLADWDFSTWE
jgi:DNA-binding CsgD family transcriptional regulator